MEQDWKHYARSVLLFSAAGWLVLYVILRTQAAQPLNPESFGSGPWDLSFNTASSFISNTSWQYYAGETTLSNFAQMTGITVASFTSCATGMAVAIAMIRGLARRGTDRLGSFWVDLVRSIVYVLVPLSAIAAFAGYTGFIQPLAGSAGSHGVAFADLVGGVVMLAGRFVPIIAALAIAGSLGTRRVRPPGLGTLRTDTPVFVIYVIGFVVISAVLTFLTVLMMAPFAQALSPRMLS